MTDQCFDEPDRGREPTTLSVNTTYSHALPEEWIRVNTSAIRNTASKLELAKKALGEYANELHECTNRLLPTSHVYLRVKNILKQLEG